jgi:hypothetical protein
MLAGINLERLRSRALWLPTRVTSLPPAQNLNIYRRLCKMDGLFYVDTPCLEYLKYGLFSVLIASLPR